MKPRALLAAAIVATTLVAAPACGQDESLPKTWEIASDRPVHRELGLSDEQARALGALTALVRDRYRVDQAKLDGRKDLLLGEIAARRAALLGRAEADTRDVLGQVLRPEQVARFDQLVIRIDGLDAFSSAEVRAALALDAKQEARLVELRAELLNVRGDFRLREARRLSCRLVAKIEALLTPRQRAAWSKLAGEPFDPGDDPVVEPE